MLNTMIELMEKSLNHDGTGREMRFTGGDVTPVIANGVTFATDNNVGDKIQKLLLKSYPISEEKMRELLNGPAIFHTGTESIVPIYPYQWIPVTERLPEDEKKVLCILEDGFFCILEWKSWDWLWNDGHNVYAEKDVTHWMPLPQPPKGE